MSFFSKKQEVEIEPFCRLFYENVILNCVVDGVDINAIIFDTLKNALATTDSNFANINSQKFNDEIVALQFELYALAWLHQFGDKSAVAQSIFTKNYLNENNQNDIWEAMEPYNQAIARSTTIGRTPKKPFDRVYLGRVYKTRADLFDQFHKEGFDPKSVARALNRLFSDEAWKKDITANFLMFVLCDRLGFKQDEPNKDAQQRLTFVIRMIYDGAKQSLDNIKIKN